MSDEKKMILARRTYEMLCDALDARSCNYSKEEEKLLAHFGVNGDDIPINFVIVVDAERQLVRVMSPLPFKMSEEKRMEGAIAACAASYGMADGSFDYDLSDGEVVFRMTASFRESLLGQGIFHYLIDCTCAMVDKYNDQFLAVDKGLMSINDFVKNS